jgi:hypothetical protein
MLTVSVLSSNDKPAEEGIPFQLVSVGNNPMVVSSAKTDAAGVITFEVDAASVGQVAVRLDVDSWVKMDSESRTP